MTTPNNTGVDLSAATAADILQAGASGGTFTAVFCNRSATVTAKVRLGCSATTGFEAARYLWFDFEIEPLQTAEFPGIPLEGDEYLIAYSDVVDVNALGMGLDK